MPWVVAIAILGTIILLAAHGGHVSALSAGRRPGGGTLSPAQPVKLRTKRAAGYSPPAPSPVIVLLIAVAGRPAEIRERWQHLFASGRAPAGSLAYPPP